MQSRKHFFSDLAKVANSAAGTVAGVKDEVEQIIKHRVEEFIQSLNLVTREEFDVAQSLVTKARQEQEKLEKRIALLEESLKQKSVRKKRGKHTKN